MGFKIHPDNGTILDIQSLALNNQYIVPYSTAYQAARQLFQLRNEGNNVVVGPNPHTYTVLRVFRNHCDKVARSTSTTMVFNQIVPTSRQVVMTSLQASNSNGIGVQELVNDIDAPISRQ